MSSPYLHGDHLHLDIHWEGQVGLEALGQGHKEMQGGQQVLVEDSWEGRGYEVRAKGPPKPGAPGRSPSHHNHPLKTKGACVWPSGNQRPGDLYLD